MDIIVIAGLWMPVTVWDATAAALEAHGHRPVPVALPGVDDGSSDASLDDQVGAVLAAVDSADRPVVVGHSAASTLAWIAADRRPDAIAGAVLIGGFPSEHDSTYAAFFDVADGVMAFPGWEPFEGPDTADLDDGMRARLAASAVAVPEAVAHGRVTYGDDRRFTVPVTVVCPEFGPADVTGWIEAGHVPELERVERLDLVDLDTGHWPMVTRPDELATILTHVASSLGPSGGGAQ